MPTGRFLLLLRESARRVLARIEGPYSHKSYSQEGEDMVLRRIFDGQQRGFYVDVGAHHPKRFSNTYLFYKLGWRGINIEPNPESMEQFRRYRARDINVDCGVSDIAGELSYVMFDDAALNTFDPVLADERNRTTPYRIVARKTVKVRRLDAILGEKLPANTQIDFLTVDAEGHDLAVLKSNDWKRYRPRWVLVESLGEQDLGKIEGGVYSFMVGQGYVWFAKTVNTLFFMDEQRKSM